jgi:ChrR Cupin-like domain
MQQIYTPSDLLSVQVIDMQAHAWQTTSNPGLHLKPVRHDDENGHFLGLVKFDAFTRSGLHQHQGLATSFVIDGGLTDYHGSIKLHEAGINLNGATHDAIAYANTVLVSKLEAPVIYPPNAAISGVHAGSRAKDFSNPAPLEPPELNIQVDSLPKYNTGYDGVVGQTIFDYGPLQQNRRYCQIHITPQSKFDFIVAVRTEFWVRGGNLSVNGIDAYANCFIICEPGAHIEIDSPFGALLLAWAEGPELSDSAHRNLFGF